MRKRIVALLALSAAIAIAFTGCNTAKEGQTEQAQALVVASFYPVYALAARITADVPELSLTCLIQPQDGCPRSYVLSDWDAALLSGAGAIILGGRGLESFESALTGGSMAVISAMGALELIENGASVEGDHTTGANPWLFLSVDGARAMSESIAASMAALDPDYAHLYEKNWAKADADLAALKADMLASLDGIQVPPAILLHEGLAYFAREMGVAESVLIAREPGEEPIGGDLDDMLSEMAKTGYRLALIERQAPQSLIDALAAEGYAVCKIDTLMTRFPADGGEGYFTAMRDNANALAEAVLSMQGDASPLTPRTLP